MARKITFEANEDDLIPTLKRVFGSIHKPEEDESHEDFETEDDIPVSNRGERASDEYIPTELIELQTRVEIFKDYFEKQAKKPDRYDRTLVLDTVAMIFGWEVPEPEKGEQGA